jgi:excisionase family DNA binding protein
VMAIRESQYLKASEVAEILNMDLSAIYKMCAAKVIPSIKVGEKAVRIPRAAFEAYLARQEKGYAPSHPLLEEAQQGDVPENRDDALVEQNTKFHDRTGYSAYEFASAWKAGKISDTAETASQLIEALAIREALTRAGVGDKLFA